MVNEVVPLPYMETEDHSRGRKFSKTPWLVIPGAIAVLCVWLSNPRPNSLGGLIALGAFVYLLSYVVLLAAYHGFMFFRGFFRDR